MHKKGSCCCGCKQWQWFVLLFFLFFGLFSCIAGPLGCGIWEMPVLSNWINPPEEPYEPPDDVNNDNLMSECAEISSELTEREMGRADICDACSLKTLFRTDGRACYLVEDEVDNCIDSLETTIPLYNCQVTLRNYFLSGFVTYQIEGAGLALTSPSGGVIGHMPFNEVIAQPCEGNEDCVLIDVPSACIEEPDEPVEPGPPVYLPYGVGLVAECGNGIKETGEECDDGNNIDGDGCSAQCLEEDTAPVTEEVSLPEEIICNEEVIDINELLDLEDDNDEEEESQ